MKLYFEYFDCHDTPITIDPFDEFIDGRGYHFSSVQFPFESTTVVVDPLDNFLDTHESPFYLVHFPSRSTIACCEQ